MHVLRVCVAHHPFEKNVVFDSAPTHSAFLARDK